MTRELQSDAPVQRRLVRGFLVGLATAACGLALIFTPLGTIFERTFGLDWLFKSRGSRPSPPEVVVVSINGNTGPALNLPRLPHHWPRSIHARLIEGLIERNAGAIVFAVDFSRSKTGDQDAIFARAIAEADRVVLFEWLAFRREPLLTVLGTKKGWTWIEERRPPTKILAMAAKALGPFPLPKLDQAALEFWAFKSSVGGAPTIAAVALQLKALSAYDEWLSVLKEARAPDVQELPTSAREFKSPAHMDRLMQKLRQMFQQDASLQQRVVQALERVQSEKRQLLVALAGLYAGPDHYYLNFYGPPGTVRTIPYESLISDNKRQAAEAKLDLTNHMVFVGYSDLYEPDQPGFYTSFTGSGGVDLSGVEIMATAYANLLNQRTIQPSEITITALAVLSFGLVIGAVVYLLPATAAVPLALAFTGLYAGFVQWRFNEADLWLPLSTPVLVQLPVALFMGLMLQYLFERQKEKKTRGQLESTRGDLKFTRDRWEHMTEPEVVKKLLEAPSGLRTEKRKVTVIFSDIHGWTPLAASLSPDQCHELVNRFYAGMEPIIRDHFGGTIIDYAGDGILGAFGVFAPQEDDPERAIACAIEMQLAIPSINDQNLDDGLPDIWIGIGIHTGEATVGFVGSQIQKYAVSGSHVNLASRIQAKTERGQILISETTRQGVPPILKLGRSQELIRFKGFEQFVNVYEVLGIDGRHKLFLPENKDRHVPLKAEISIRYEVIEGSCHASKVHKGALTKLTVTGPLTKPSIKAAEARLEGPVPPSSDLGLHLLDPDGKEVPGTLYAKVVGTAPGSNCRFAISFTWLSADIQAFLQGLTKHAARVD